MRNQTEKSMAELCFLMKLSALETTLSPEEMEQLSKISNWRERMMSNFRVVVCLDSEEGNWKYQVKRHPCLVTEATIILFNNWSYETLVSVGRSSLKGKHSPSQERAIKAMSEVHLKMQGQMDATPGVFTEFLEQFASMPQPASQLQQGVQGVEFLEMTLKKLEELENALVEMKKALKGNPR